MKFAIINAFLLSILLCLKIQIALKMSLMNGKKKFRVMYSAITVHIFTIAFGCTLSYPAPAISNINANRNPFHVDIYEQSWIGSLSLLGNAIGSVVCGFVADTFGRKIAMMTSATLCCAGFTLVASATDVHTMYAGVFLTGIFSSINCAAVLLYCSEIADSDNRGVLVSMFGAAGTLGSVFVLVAGSFLPWNWLAIFAAAFYVFPPFSLVFLPESPRWFLLKGNREAAAQSLQWFRGEGEDIATEMEVIGRSLVDALTGMSAWKDLLRRRNAKPLLIVCILLTVQSFSGNFVIAIFTVTLFQDAAVDISPNLQSVISVLFSFLGSVSCLFVIDRCGRRRLLFVSTLFTALGMGTIATFFQVKESDSNFAISNLWWLPMFGLSISNFLFHVGLLPIPWVFACELFSTNVRGVVMTVVSVFSSLLSFLATKTFANLQSVLDTSGAIWFYVACGVVGIVFVAFVLKEPQQQIMD